MLHVLTGLVHCFSYHWIVVFFRMSRRANLFLHKNETDRKHLWNTGKIIGIKSLHEELLSRKIMINLLIVNAWTWTPIFSTAYGYYLSLFIIGLTLDVFFCVPLLGAHFLICSSSSSTRRVSGLNWATKKTNPWWFRIYTTHLYTGLY